MNRFVITVLLLIGTAASALGQNSIVGEVSTDHNRNSIIRDCNGKLVVYGENPAGDGCLTRVSDPSANHTASSIMMPQGIHIKDFTCHDGIIYFVGYQQDLLDSTAVVGKVPLTDFDQTWAGVEYNYLNPFVDRESNDGMQSDPTCLWRLVAYTDESNSVHIVAVGENQGSYANAGVTSVIHQYGLYDVVFGQPQYRFAISNEMLFDLDIVDNYIVAAGRKGPLSDLSCSGYLVLRSMMKNNDPIGSIAGRYGHRTDGFTYANGNVRIARTGQGRFALTYMVEEGGVEYFEISHMKINGIESVSPLCTQRTVHAYNTRPFYLSKDILFCSETQSLCVLSDCDWHAGHTVFKANRIGECLELEREFCHTGIKLQSLCEYGNTFWAGCGIESAHSLNIMVQEINAEQSCGQIYPDSSSRKATGISSWVDRSPLEADQRPYTLAVPVVPVQYQTTCIK